MCQKHNPLPVTSLETVKVTSLTFWLSSNKKAGFFPKFKNTNNWQNCMHTTRHAPQTEGERVEECLTSLLCTLLCHFQCCTLPGRKKETTTFTHRFPEGRRPNCHCSVALGTFRESDSGKIKCDADPNDTMICSL